MNQSLMLRFIKKMNIELLKKYFNNNCSSEEVDIVVEWFKTNAGDLKGRLVLKKLWNEMEEDEVNDVDFDQLLDKIHHKINIQKTKNINHLQTNKKGVVKSLIPFLVKIAASLFIPLLALSLYYYSKDLLYPDKPIYSEIISPNGSRTTFELPDGSKVWLNNGSSLKFPIRFTGNQRVLELKGEAYFQITHNKDMPLVVKTNDIQVLVHGTEFNVMAYPKDNNLTVTLVNGSVSMQKMKQNNEAKELLMLKPNQQAVYDIANSEIDYMTVDPVKYVAWKNGKLIFVDDSIDIVMQKLERWYNVEINLKDKDLSKITYTATFTDETLRQILELLKIAAPIDYKIFKSYKLNDGSFSKRKVEISLRQ